MFGSSLSPVHAYAKVGLETSVLAANPHKLIAMLFDGALVAITNAKVHMEKKEISAKGNAISKAITIIDSGLRSSLNMQAGGEIARNMNALYEYMTTRLQMAHLKNDPALLNEVYGLLSELKSAWDGIHPQYQSKQSITSPQDLGIRKA